MYVNFILFYSLSSKKNEENIDYKSWHIVHMNNRSKYIEGGEDSTSWPILYELPIKYN